MGSLNALDFLSRYHPADFAQEGVNHQAPAHPDLPMDPPYRKFQSGYLHGFAPGQDMLIHTIDQRAVQIEQEANRLNFSRSAHHLGPARAWIFPIRHTLTLPEAPRKSLFPETVPGAFSVSFAPLRQEPGTLPFAPRIPPRFRAQGGACRDVHWSPSR